LAQALKVQLTSQLITALASTGQSPALLQAKFTEWKSSEPDEHYWFSREVIGDFGLLHVHMIPQNEPERRKQWESDWKNYRKRRSDRYLIFANGGPRLGYLLIDLIEDPGAHLLWERSQKSKLSALERLADNFIHGGLVP
jgi:hypothetical protein